MKRRDRKSKATASKLPVYTALEDFRWQSGALIVLLLIAYANGLSSSFHFDDYAILNDAYITGPGLAAGLFRLDQTRPLTYLTFHWNYLAAGQDTFGYHCVNLLLHAANSILLLAIARKYFSPRVAGCIALIFALHPLQTEAVTYVFSRSTLLSTHFALWTIWFFGLEKWSWSAAMFGVSLLAKEETIALPAFLLMLDWQQRRRPKPAYYAALAGLMALAAGRLFYLIYKSPLEPGIGRVRGISGTHYLLTQGRVLWDYLRLTVLPIGLNLDHDVALSTGLFTPWTTIVAWLALVTVGGWLFWQAFRPARSPWQNSKWTKTDHESEGLNPGFRTVLPRAVSGTISKAAVWSLGFFVLIAPSSSVVPQADLMFEHRTYLPLVCLAIALGFVLERLPQASLMTGIAVLTPVLLVATVNRNAVWSDEKSLWTDVMAKSPQKSRSYLGLAKAYSSEDPARARELLRRGLELEPGNPELQVNYGIALMGAQQPAEALAHFQKVNTLTWESADSWSNIGAAQFLLKQYANAGKSYERALLLDPCSYRTRRNLMALYAETGRPKDAWIAGDVPSSCKLIPDELRDLESIRQRVGTP